MVGMRGKYERGSGIKVAEKGPGGVLKKTGLVSCISEGGVDSG